MDVGDGNVGATRIRMYVLSLDELVEFELNCVLVEDVVALGEGAGAE